MEATLFKSRSGGVELNDVFICVWCEKQQSTQLVQLGCFHLACKVCLQSILQYQKPGTQFNCPKCNMLNTIPTGGVAGFPDETLQHIAVIFSNQKPNCTFCAQASEVSSVCTSCQTYLCKKDARYHQDKHGHNVISFEELYYDPKILLTVKSKNDICQEHSLKKNKFCKKCRYTICRNCEMLNHSDHKKDLVENVAAKYNGVLKEMMSEFKKSEVEMKQSFNESKKTLEEIYKEYARTAKYQMHTEKIESLHIKENLEIMNKETNLLATQITSNINEEKYKIKQLNSARCYMKVFLNFSSDLDIVENFDEVFTKLQKTKKNIDLPFLSLSKDMQDLRVDEHSRGTKGIERKRPSGLDETKGVERRPLEGLRNMPDIKLVGRKTTGCWNGVAVWEDEILVVYDQTRKWYSMDWKNERAMNAELEGAYDVEVCEGEVFVSDSEKRAVIVFDAVGKVKRSLWLPDTEQGVNIWNRALCLAVDKTNKDVYVSSYKTDTVYKFEGGIPPFKTWIRNKWSGSWYICVTPNHQLVVSHFTSNSVVKYDSKGELMWEYKGPDRGQLSGPSGVCMDPWGHIYIADSNNGRIVIISMDGQFLFTINDISGPSAVNFNKDRLIVTSGFPVFGHTYVYKVKFL